MPKYRVLRSDGWPIDPARVAVLFKLHEVFEVENPDEGINKAVEQGYLEAVSDEELSEPYTV